VQLGDLPSALLMILAVINGLIWGSFLNVVIYRVPRGMSVLRPAQSMCPACEAPIAPYDNIPVLSWMLLRGRARCCGVAISPRYPAVEALGGLTAAVVYERLIAPLPGDTSLWIAFGTFFLYLGLALGLLAAMFIDLEHMILPDSITLGGAALGLVTLPLRPISWPDALVGGSLGYLVVWGLFHHVYRLVRGRPGMGLGDAKLLMLVGVWFGWQGAAFALVAGAFQGTVVAVVLLLTQGSIDEPQAVKDEREALRQELAQLAPEERAQLQAEVGDDLLATEPEPGFSGARLAFGPFLVVATLEYLFARDWIMLWLFELMTL
jgi:leader peptidase (prepilin peptidase) / N-methyltransferase